MLSTGGFTCVAFVTGALAWWGPRFIDYGLQIQAGTANKDVDRYARLENLCFLRHCLDVINLRILALIHREYLLSQQAFIVPEGLTRKTKI